MQRHSPPHAAHLHQRGLKLPQASSALREGFCCRFVRLGQLSAGCILRPCSLQVILSCVYGGRWSWWV